MFLHVLHVFDKRLNNTLPSRYHPPFPISAISPQISISKTTSLNVSAVSIHFPLPVPIAHCKSSCMSTGTVHSCPVTQKCMQRPRAKICCQNPILIIFQYPRQGQAELCRRNDGLTSAWTTIISVLWRSTCPAKAERAWLQSCEHRQQSW